MQKQNESLLSETYKSLGNQKFQENQFKEALKCYEMAIKMKPEYKEAWFNKGLCHRQLKEFDQAKEAFKTAFELDTNYEKARYNYRCLTLPAQVIFGIVDLKLTPSNEVKILEFGRGVQSGHSGYDHLHPDSPILKEINKFVTQSLHKPLYIGARPGLNDTFDDDFPAFLTQIGSSDQSKATFQKIADYKGLYLGNLSTSIPSDILVMDDSPEWRLVSENKFVMDQVFASDHELAVFRPASQVFPLSYTPDLSKRITDLISADKYVLKAPDLTRGNGVIIVNRNELDDTLKILLSYRDPVLLQNASSDFSKKLLLAGYTREQITEKISALGSRVDNWMTTNSSMFLVEEYCPSKIIMHMDKKYIPTMRVSFMITIEHGEAKFYPLGCYWKFPKSPLNEGSIIDSSLSHVDIKNLSQSVGKVSKADRESVYKQLEKCLPLIFLKMLTFDVQHMILELRKKQENFYQRQAETILYHFANALSSVRRSDQALELMKGADKKEFKYYHEKGVIYTNAGKYQKAIEKFDRAIERNSGAGSTFFRRARVHEKLDRRQNALADLIKAKHLGFNSVMVDHEMEKITKKNATTRMEKLSSVSAIPSLVSPQLQIAVHQMFNRSKFQLTSVDLHGLSEEEAKITVIQKIKHASQAYGDKTNRIRFITGRGNHVNARGNRGTLYQNFREWLVELKQDLGQIHQYDGYYEIEIQRDREFYDPITRSMNDQINKMLSDNIQNIKLGAEHENPDDLFALAICYQHGIGVPQDYKEMTNIFIKLADKGDPIAQFEVGASYFIGRGIRLNDELAIKNFKNSADQNYVLAELTLGNIYWNGIGVTVDYNLAYQYLFKAANHGQGEAARKVGCFHSEGYGGTVDHHAAVSWWELGDKLEDGTSSYNLYLTFLRGLGGINPDHKKAHHYLKRSAQFHDPDGECDYGIALLFGHYAEKDEEAGLEYLRQAMNHLSARAAYSLFIYRVRHGIDRSPLEEVKSYLITAAELGHILAKFFVVICGEVFNIDEKLREDTKENLFKKSDDEILNIQSLKYIHLIIDLFLEPENSKKQIKKGINLLRKLAERDDLEAIQKLYTIFLKGDLIEPNPQEGHKYLLQGAGLGDHICLNALGYFWQNGMGGKVDDAKAFDYFTRAADKKDANSHNQLGIFYKNGRFVKASTQEAEKHFRLAMELDDPKKRTPDQQNVFSYACFNLGMILLTLSDREAEGLSLLVKATEDKHPDAPFVLAQFYNCLGEKNLFLFYLLKASQAGNPIAKGLLNEASHKEGLDLDKLYNAFSSLSHLNK